jgi:hypothetical protein
MGEACSAHTGHVKYANNFHWKDHYEYLGVNFSMDFTEIGLEGVEWIHLVQGRGR